MGNGRVRGISGSDVRAAVLYLVVVVVLCLSGITNAPLLRGGGPVWPVGVSLALMLVAGVLTLFRTSRPEVLLMVTVPVALAEILLGGQVSAYVLLVEGLWAPVARGKARSARAATVLGIVVGAVMAVAMLVGWTAAMPLSTVVVLGAMVIVVTVFTPLAWGWEVRHHRLAQEAAEELARTEHQLAGERAAREIEVDRLHIAQDLHDVVAGHLTAVALHTNLALDLANQDSTARDRSLATARDSAEAALRDLRSVIGVLASPGPGSDSPVSSSAPSLNWEILRQRLGEGATVEVDGRVDDPSVVSPGVRTVLLHICAEAVTNAVRHGRAPRALAVAVEDDQVVLTCENHRIPGPVRESTTLGLRTMDNRARAAGGTVTARPSGPSVENWLVRADIPLDGGH